MGENKMKLEKLLERMDYKVLAGSTDIEISTLVYDSRIVSLTQLSLEPHPDL